MGRTAFSGLVDISVMCWLLSRGISRCLHSTFHRRMAWRPSTVRSSTSISSSKHSARRFSGPAPLWSRQLSHSIGWWQRALYPQLLNSTTFLISETFQTSSRYLNWQASFLNIRIICGIHYRTISVFSYTLLFCVCFSSFIHKPVCEGTWQTLCPSYQWGGSLQGAQHLCWYSKVPETWWIIDNENALLLVQ